MNETPQIAPSPRSFTDSKPFVVGKALVRHKKNCRLCGHVFAEGDGARWIYCNSTPGQGTGNFFVCSACDDTDENCMAKAKESRALAVRLAKQWGIYGPDWEREARYDAR